MLHFRQKQILNSLIDTDNINYVKVKNVALINLAATIVKFLKCYNLNLYNYLSLNQ